MSILKLAGLQEQAMIQVTPPGTPKPPAMQPQLTLPQTQTQMAPTAMGNSTTAVSGSDVKQPGQMEEELHGDQHKLDVDDDGEIEGSDLAALRISKMDEAEVEEGNLFTKGLADDDIEIGEKIPGTTAIKTKDIDENTKLDECGEMGPMANGMTDKQESRMNVSTNMSSDGTQTVTVTADGKAAEELMQLLSLAGMEQKHIEPEVMMYEAKDSRYEANTTPDEKVLSLDTQLQGGTGEVAGKTKKMTPHGYKYADNNLAIKENQVAESRTLNFLKEYESLLVKKKLSESDSPRAQDRFGLELGDLLIETNVLGVTKDGIVLETDTWSYNHLNKLGYISKEELTESTMIFEGEQTVNIEDHDTGERIDVIVNYSSDDGEIVFDEVEVVNNPEKELSNAELNEVYKELINILQQTGEPDYYTDDDDRLDPRQREYYSNFPMNYTGTKDTMEAKYQGREVPLGKPMAGDVAKSKVYVRGPKGNVVKVNFGDKNMRIKKSNPKRRKSFRARHNCANPGPRWKARYWSCRAW